MNFPLLYMYLYLCVFAFVLSCHIITVDICNCLVSWFSVYHYISWLSDLQFHMFPVSVNMVAIKLWICFHHYFVSIYIYVDSH